MAHLNSYLIYFLLFFIIISAIFAYPTYKLNIPNGENVPNPCVANTIWKAIGHENINGGGKNNPFGLDFIKQNYKWTKELCQMDSDGDGDSNGKELGDELCVWTPGNVPSVTLLNSLSNPAICEPMDSPLCKEKNSAWTVCDQQQEFECDFNSQGQDDGVTSKVYQFPETPVPPTETNYYCGSFQLLPEEDNTEYHIIASKPKLVNENVMHHMILYGCNDYEDERYKNFLKPAPCGMEVSSSCSNMIASWTVGAVGECYEGPFGYLIGGVKGIKRAILEVHWNNPLLVEDMTDASGIEIFYTSNLRQNNLGVLTIGPMDLYLPPGLDKVEQSGTCSGACVSQLFDNQDINIVSVNNHMHYTGRKGYVKHYRDGKLLNVLAADEEYSYDSPVDHYHDPEVVVKPGDELKMTCVFSTKDKKKPIFYGDGTQAEMCFGFITYYPYVQNANEGCIMFGGLDSCELWTQYEGCNQTEFWNNEETYEHFYKVWDQCSIDECNQQCVDVLNSWYNTESCLNGHEGLRKSMTSTIIQIDPKEFDIGGTVGIMMQLCEPHLEGVSASVYQATSIPAMICTMLALAAILMR